MSVHNRAVHCDMWKDEKWHVQGRHCEFYETCAYTITLLKQLSQLIIACHHAPRSRTPFSFTGLIGVQLCSHATFKGCGTFNLNV